MNKSIIGIFLYTALNVARIVYFSVCFSILILTNFSCVFFPFLLMLQTKNNPRNRKIIYFQLRSTCPTSPAHWQCDRTSHWDVAAFTQRRQRTTVQTVSRNSQKEKTSHRNQSDQPRIDGSTAGNFGRLRQREAKLNKHIKEKIPRPPSSPESQLLRSKMPLKGDQFSDYFFACQFSAGTPIVNTSNVEDCPQRTM